MHPGFSSGHRRQRALLKALGEIVTHAARADGSSDLVRAESRAGRQRYGHTSGQSMVKRSAR
jgi:hypothetical protein